MKPKYDYSRLRRDLQDEYMAAMLVGAGENTPDLMDLEMCPNEALPEAAKRLGYNIEDYAVSPDEESFEIHSEGALRWAGMMGSKNKQGSD